MKKIRLIFDWGLPILCLANMIIYWGHDNTFTAWVVAFAGWSSVLINRHNKHDNNSTGHTST